MNFTMSSCTFERNPSLLLEHEASECSLPSLALVEQGSFRTFCCMGLQLVLFLACPLLVPWHSNEPCSLWGSESTLLFQDVLNEPCSSAWAKNEVQSAPKTQFSNSLVYATPPKRAGLFGGNGSE